MNLVTPACRWRQAGIFPNYGGNKMSENLQNRRRGLSSQGLHTWGMVFLAAGIFGRALIQNGLLGVQVSSTQQLLELMQSSDMMMYATAAIVLQVVQACATPVFVFLLLEGFQHTASLKNYFFRIAGIAVLSEIPYNLAYSRSWLDSQSRNPVFALLICLVVLYFYRRYTGHNVKNLLIKLLVTVCAFLWASILGIDEGGPCVLLAACLWAFRTKRNIQILAGCVATFLCCLFSPFYMVAPLVFLALFLYNGEKGEGNRIVSYLAYPVLLLAFGLAGLYLV